MPDFGEVLDGSPKSSVDDQFPVVQVAMLGFAQSHLVTSSPGDLALVESSGAQGGGSGNFNFGNAPHGL